MAADTGERGSVLDAIARGDGDALRDALARDPAGARVRGDGGQSALLFAVYHGRQDLVPLIAAHAAPDVHDAAAIGDVARLEALLDADPAPLGAYSPDGWTPLHLAAFFADAPTVQALLARGADVGARSRNSTANMPLHAAIAGRRDAEVIRRLVEGGADVNARAGGGWTPLHLAASRGDVALIDYLLAQGAQPRATADDGRGIVEIAAAYGHPEAESRARAATTVDA
jgi:ankyrin repeat protein